MIIEEINTETTNTCTEYAHK